MRGKRGAVTACFWVLKNTPRVSTLFFMADGWAVMGEGPVACAGEDEGSGLIVKGRPDIEGL
jgi:hypothetical protein